MDDSNDSLSATLSVGFVKNSLVINEIMYAPVSAQSEWIELYNPNLVSINIQNWKISDSDSSDKQKITNKSLLLTANSFVLISADSGLTNYFDLNYSPIFVIKSLPALNNNQDHIFIFDNNNNIIDEVNYLDDWGGDTGVSLERINPKLASNDSSNWNSCVDLKGGTPGQQNSIFVEVLPSNARLSISPDPFSPDGDGRDDVTIISYQLPFNLSQIHVKIYDVRGRLVRFLVNNQPSGINNSIIWDGRNNDGNICRMGIYIVYLEAIHISQGVVNTIKKSVVLAKKL